MNYKQQMWEAYHYRFGLAGEVQADIIQSELERRPGRVLTVGCGFLGEKIDNLAKHCLLLIAVDRSVQVLQRAAINVIQPNVHLLAADAQQLPFTSDSFEHILALGLFAYIPEPSSVLRELRRICHSGGMVMLTNAVRHPREPLRVAAASAGFEILREHEGYCPAASGETKRRYLMALVARNRKAS